MNPGDEADGGATAWFEPLYASAEGDPSKIPWADERPNPWLVEWLDQHDPAQSSVPRMRPRRSRCV